MTPRFTTVIPASGPLGNIFAIVGTACRHMRELDVPQQEIAAFANQVMIATSYRAAVEVVREWFPVELEGE